MGSRHATRRPHPFHQSSRRTRRHADAARTTRRAAVAALAVGTAALAGCNADARNRALAARPRPRGAHRRPGGRPGGRGTGRRSWPFAGTRDAARWDQVPVQVDERHVRSSSPSSATAPAPPAPKALAYSDPSANAGADPVTDLRRRRRGRVHGRRHRRAAPRPEPATRRGSSRAPAWPVTVTDPLAGTSQWRGQRRRLRLPVPALRARSTPGAGVDYVDYDFAPGRPDGPRRGLHGVAPTATPPTSPPAGPATRSRLGAGPGHPRPPPQPLRGRRSASAARTRSRPATAATPPTSTDPCASIRSYLGANSGTYTQREHIFYRGAERVQTFLRVHAIPGIIDFYDYSPAAVGMRYSSSSTPGRHRSTACPTRRGSAAPTWEAVAGAQGTLVTVYQPRRPDISGVTMQGYYTGRQHAAGRRSARATRSSTAPAAPPSPAPSRTPTPRIAGPVTTFTATRWNVYVPAGESAERAAPGRQPGHTRSPPPWRPTC